MAKRQQQRRNKGEGSIIELPNGKYKATITIGKGVDGKQKRRSITCKSKPELINKITELKVKYSKASEGQQKDILFSAFCEKWLASKENQLAYNTYQKYKLAIDNHYTPFFGTLSLSSITPELCDNFFQQLKGAANTIKILRTVLGSIFNDAQKQQYINVNPLSRIMFKTPKAAIKANIVLPTPKEIDEMLNLAKKQSRWLYTLLLLDIATGMRRGELIGLKWSKVDTTKNTITIDNQITSDQKDSSLKTTSSYRTIYVSHKILEEVCKLPHTSAYVFTNNNKHLIPTSLTMAATKLFKEANMPEDFTLHDLRHYHATQLIQKGVNIKVVSRRLGHTNVLTTLNLYFNYMPSMDEEASTMFDNLL